MKTRISYFRRPKYSIVEGEVRVDWKLVGCLIQEGENYGISLCSKKDQFSRKLARQIALGRLKKGGERECRNPSLPKELEEQFQYFQEKYRAQRQVQRIPVRQG